MAGAIRAFLRPNHNLVRSILLRSSPAPVELFAQLPAATIASRLLHTDRSLGINGYENTRINYHSQFLNMESMFREKMEEALNDSDSMIFTEDMKAILHLIQKNDADLNLMRRMLVKFNQQDTTRSFGTFIFGPVVMRALYFLNEPHLALEMFNDQTLQPMFNQTTSQNILLSLLYKNNMYQEVRDMYNVISAIPDITPNRSLLTVTMAACAKENTEDSLDYAMQHWGYYMRENRNVIRQSLNLLCYLALKLNKPHIALEAIATNPEPNYFEIMSVKISAYIQLKRYSQIVNMMRTVTHNFGNGKQSRGVIFSDVFKMLEESHNDWEESFPVIYDMLQQLQKFDLINSQTFEEFCFRPIDNEKLTSKRFIDNKLQDVRGQNNWDQKSEDGEFTRHRYRDFRNDKPFPERTDRRGIDEGRRMQYWKY